MITQANEEAGRPQKRGGWGRHTVPMDDELFAKVKALARRDRTTIRALMERAITLHLLEDTASRTDSTMAPLIDRLMLERHRRLETGLRSMMARVAYEVLRSQFVVMNFVAEAGVPASKVSAWYEEGWQYAVRGFRQQPSALDADEEVR